MNYLFKFLFCSFIVSYSVFSVDAQMKRRVSVKSGEVVEIAANTDQTPEPTPTKTPVKKNDRPDSGNNSSQKPDESQKNPSKSNALDGNTKMDFPYKYEFSQPNFIVKHVIIEHDENGKGKITFEKKNAGEPITDPVLLSSVSLEKINSLLQILNFLDSTENYQSPTRDYGHLGNYEITLKKDGKQRTAKYNWSENLNAKALANEYRKISEQSVWLFDMSVARENQPLEAPGLMDRLDSMLKRNEISDPPQLLPSLKDFSNDERIPLMARNHATRIIKEIEKKGK